MDRSVISIIVCLVIIASTWRLLQDSLRLSMDGVPENLNREKIKEEILKIEQVKDFHHLHIWAISTTENAITGHWVVSNNLSNAQVAELKHKVKHQLEHLNIHYAILESETEICEENVCQ